MYLFLKKFMLRLKGDVFKNVQPEPGKKEETLNVRFCYQTSRSRRFYLKVDLEGA